MKFYILFFSLFFSTIQLVNSQNQQNIDSLLKIYSSTKVDSIRLKTNNRITSYYLYRDINKAKSYAIKQLKLAKQIENIKGEINASHQLTTVYNILSKHDSARYYIESTIKLSKLTNNLIQQSSSRHSLANLEISLGNLELAQEINSENLEFNEKIKDTFGVALSYDLESSIYIKKGQPLIALKSILKSLDIMRRLGKKIRIADALNKLAVIENSLENYDSSIEYSKEALKIYEEFEDIEYQASMLNVLGISYKFKKDFTSAKKYLNRSAQISESNGYKSILLVSQSHLIDIYFETNDSKKAKELLDDGFEIANSIGYESMVLFLRMRLAIYYKNINEYSKAHRLLDTLINNPKIDLVNLSEIYKIKSKTYKKQNNYKDALTTYETYKKLQDSTFKRKNISKINELRVIHKTEQKEAEIALQQEEIKTLNVQSKNDKLTKTLYGIGMFSFLTIAGLLYFGFKQRIKKNKIAREKQEEIYKQEIAFKKKELTSQTLHLVQKSTFIQELKENLEKIKKSPELFKVEFRRLVMLLKKESAEDKDWEVFKSYFSEVHNNFDNKIKAIAEDITEKEIRLASFLRMNLSTKEIASMLNVLPDSVLKSKYRLKKKLALDKTYDLTQFLNTL